MSNVTCGCEKGLVRARILNWLLRQHEGRGWVLGGLILFVWDLLHGGVTLPERGVGSCA